MAVSAFTVANIKPSLNIDSSQRFIFGLAGSPEPLGSFKLDNIFVPTISNSSQTNFESRNNTFSGFRWVHTTNNTATFGQLKLQSFVNASPTGTDILLFNNDGTVIINNLNIGSPLRITYNSPLSALYLLGPITTQAGFVYSSSSTETLLFSATALRISSTSGQINFSLDSTSNDFITFNNQGFKSIVNFIANNPDTSGFIPEKGLIFQTLGTSRGALTFDRVANQMKLYTSTNDPIVFATNNVNSMQILTNGNIDLLNHRITNAANPVNPQDYTTKAYVDSAVDNSFGPNVALPFYQLNYNWAYTSVTNPTPYEVVNTFTDSQISKNFKYRVLTNNISSREWNHEYILIGNSDLNGIYNLNYKSVAGTTAALSIAVYPFAASQNTMFMGVRIDMGGFEIRNALNPTTPQSLSTKKYVDDNIAGLISSNPITLTGAVTGINSINNPIFTSFSSTIPISGANQTFNFSLNSNVKYKIVNTLCATVGTPSTVGLDLLNCTTGGYRHLHTSSTTDLGGIGTYKFQIVNSVGVTADVYTASISGGGIPNLAINGNASFAQDVTFSGTLVNAVVNLPSYAWNLNNTNSGGVTEYTISQTIPYLKLGYNGSSGQAYIDSVFQPFYIRMAGTNYFTFSTIGNMGIGTTGPTQAKLVINGGVQNIAGEESAIRVISALNSVKIELQNTAVSGRLYEITSSNIGNFNITDRTGGATRFILNNVGNIGIGGSTSPNAALQFGNIVSNRRIVLFEAANNDHQYYGFGINNSTLRYQVDGTLASHIWYAATSSSTSVELMRLFGNGQLVFTDASIGSSRIALNNTNAASFANSVQFQNNGVISFEVGFNNSTNESYLWSTNNSALKFGTNTIERFRITNAGDSIFTGTIYGRRASGCFYMQGNLVATTLTANTWTKIAGTTTNLSLNQFSTPVSNRIQYTSTVLSPILASITASVTCNFSAGGGGVTRSFAIFKNGVQVTPSVMVQDSGSGVNITLSTTTLVSMVTNDYIEVFIQSVNNTNVTVSNLILNITTT